jgi:hypothetical protein
MKSNNNKKSNFSLKEEETFEKFCQLLENPDYEGGAYELPENPTSLEKAKYEMCQKILNYKINNNLTAEKIAKKIHLTVPETKEIL